MCVGGGCKACTGTPPASGYLARWGQPPHNRVCDHIRTTVQLKEYGGGKEEGKRGWTGVGASQCSKVGRQQQQAKASRAKG